MNLMKQAEPGAHDGPQLSPNVLLCAVMSMRIWALLELPHLKAFPAPHADEIWGPFAC